MKLEDNNLVETVVATRILMSKEIFLPHSHQLSGARQEHYQEGDQTAAHYTVAWYRNNNNSIDFTVLLRN